MMRVLILVLLTLLYITILDISWNTVDAQTYDNMTALKRNLLAGYDKDVVPVLNQSHTLNVTVTFSLLNIQEVDTVDSLIRLKAFLHLAWTDEKLKWDPADYGDIKELSIPVDLVWTPPIFLGSGVTHENIVNTWRKVLINYTGVSHVALGGTFSSVCGFTMTFWPFDKQACNLYFVPIDSGREKMKFIFPSNPIHDSNLIQMGEWTYDQMSASYEDRFDNTGKDLIYSVKIRRQSAFYFLTLIVPLYCVSSLGLLMFLVPCDSGERVGFSVTIMLSIVVFMMVFKDEVPKSSEPLPYICIYINTIVCVSFLANIINLFSLNLFHRKDAQPVGQKYIYLVNLVSRFSGRNTVYPIEMEGNNKDDNQTFLQSTPEKQLDDILPSIRKEKQEQIEQDFISKQIVKQGGIVTWKDVSNTVDMMTFITVAPLAILGTIVGMIYLQVASDYPDWAN